MGDNDVTIRAVTEEDVRELVIEAPGDNRLRQMVEFLLDRGL